MIGEIILDDTWIKNKIKHNFRDAWFEYRKELNEKFTDEYIKQIVKEELNKKLNKINLIKILK